MYVVSTETKKNILNSIRICNIFVHFFGYIHSVSHHSNQVQMWLVSNNFLKETKKTLLLWLLVPILLHVLDIGSLVVATKLGGSGRDRLRGTLFAFGSSLFCCCQKYRERKIRISTMRATKPDRPLFLYYIPNPDLLRIQKY